MRKSAILSVVVFACVGCTESTPEEHSARIASEKASEAAAAEIAATKATADEAARKRAGLISDCHGGDAVFMLPRELGREMIRNCERMVDSGVLAEGSRMGLDANGNMIVVAPWEVDDYVAAIARSSRVAPARPKATSEHLRTPERGSPERQALMEVLRPKVQSVVGQPVVFVISWLRVGENWAFAVVEPVSPDGRPIEPSNTRLYRERNPDAIDGLRTEAIWRKIGGTWQVEEFAVGATDVWYENYCGVLPTGMIEFCSDS